MNFRFIAVVDEERLNGLKADLEKLREKDGELEAQINNRLRVFDSICATVGELTKEKERIMKDRANLGLLIRRKPVSTARQSILFVIMFRYTHLK